MNVVRVASLCPDVDGFVDGLDLSVHLGYCSSGFTRHAPSSAEPQTFYEDFSVL